MTIARGGVALAGTLVLPDGPGSHPVVLMLHGSGPLDRDENMDGQKLDVFNRLAEALAAAGYASLRYDKRGCGASGGDYPSLGYADLVADARAWADLLAADIRMGPLYFLGHSEGTVIAAKAARGRGDVAGLILLCPYVEDGETILMAQARAMERLLDGLSGWRGVVARLWRRLFGGPERQQRRLIARLRAGTEPVMRMRGQTVAARALRDFLISDNAGVHAAVVVPSLVFGAGKDIQCNPADVARIAALHPAATAVVIDDLTHVLRRDSGAHGFGSYAGLLRRDMDPVVAGTVIGWLDRRGADHPN
ncbi:MAG: alpha/beta fold hydrolase [Paracoccaceae bacterium]